ncbi:Protein argonaute 4A [Acorus gramineus]|uniref:Protein argonaute 4A n=1 Tax=Acorus gramineus TaxID=55184 RepID=A0AAV9BUD8_ACOGR|nr:Protein argonaute 4A [Acorus gramineus]
MMHACGITISTGFAQLNGRVLQPPKLRVGNGKEIIPQRGRWCLNNERVYEPAKIKRWAIVNFSATNKSFQVFEQLVKCAKQKGLLVEPLLKIFEEDSHWTKCSLTVRVDQMFQQMRKALSDNPPEFVLCILAKKNNDNIYGPWKKRCVVEHGIVTQCLALPKLNDRSYMTNLVLDINAKLGGLNFVVPIECLPLISQVSKVPTMILGLDITRGGTYQPNMPFFATVVGSRQWPSISRYVATVRVQSPKFQMIDFLFNPQPNNEDKGIIWELFQEFYTSSGGQKPEQIFIFRSGAYDSQFDQVLNIELDQIIQACRFQSRFEKLPKFTVIVAQKKHWTKFFLKSSSYNVPPGTVVDTGVCHPRYNDFYMCSHAGIIGTSRPTHYHVLLNEIGFSADALQELVLALSHSYQRSTTAVSIGILDFYS